MSSDKTAGQWVGTIVGAVIGAYAGGNAYQGALIGASLGGTVGGLIDPPKGPTIRGPRLEDLSVQNAQYGSPIASIYGTAGVSGTVIWVENNKLKEKIKKKKQGGKGGGGGSTVETYSYSGTFAVVLADAPASGIAGIRRVWVGPDLVYNAGSDDLETIIASNKFAERRFRFYNGADDQMPDPRIEAEMGVGNASAFRGTAYIVFYDLPLAKYGNSFMGAQVKVEIFDNVVSSPELLSSRIASDIDVISGCGCINPIDSDGRSWLINNAPGSSGTEAGSGRKISLSGSRKFTVRRPSVIPGGRAIYLARGISDYSPYWCTHDQSTGGDVLLYNDSGSIDLGVRRAYRVIDIADTGTYVLTNDWAGALTWRLSRIDSSGLSWVFSDTLSGPSVSAETAIAAGSGMVCVFEKISTSVLELRVYSDDLDLQRTFSVSYSGDVGSATACCIAGDRLYVVYDVNDNDIVVREIDLVREEYLAQYVVPIPGVASSTSQARPTLGHASGVFAFAQNYDSPDDVQCFVFRLSAPDSGGVALSDVVEAELTRSELIESSDIDVTDLASDVVRGYRPAGVQQVRACIGPLQMAYPFDLIMDGYQIKAVRRGDHSSVATIPAEHLDARAYGDAPGIQFDQQREMDSQLPRQVVLRHIDADREYEVNEQRSAERMSAQTVDVREIELALVLTPDEAAQVADVEMTRNWLERTPASFRLPPEYLHLQPADVVTIETDYGSFEMLLGEIAYAPDGRLECSARPNAAASYASPAVGGQGPTPDGGVPLAITPETVLLDIPLVRNEEDAAGFAAAMAGESESWPGGGLFRSNDNEQTWSDVQAWSAPATIGICSNSLTANDGLVIDRVSTLSVEMISGELESITEAQMMTGMNWAAYGADGRWELIRFANADLEPDGTYTLSTLLRGLRGSEWATGLHEDGDTIVWLDDADVMAIGADIASLNVVRQWRGISVGQTIDEADSIDFAYKGENLRPLSGVHGSAELSGADWVIAWSARTRLQGSLWKTGVALPVGEATESYLVEILDGSDVVRLLTSTTPTVTYTEAQQIEDFGSAQSSISCIVYQISASVGRGRQLEIAA